MGAGSPACVHGHVFEKGVPQKGYRMGSFAPRREAASYLASRALTGNPPDLHEGGNAMEIQQQRARSRTRKMALILAVLVALALALAVSHVVVSSGPSRSEPSTGAGDSGLSSTPSGRTYVLAPDAKDRNDQVSQPIDYGGPCWPCVGGPPDTPSPADDGRRLPH